MQAVAVPERIDAGNAVEVLSDLREAAAAPAQQPLALDLAPLRHFDSAALSLLLQLARERSDQPAQAEPAVQDHPAGVAPYLVLLNAPAKLQELAELYGIREMLFGAVPIEPQAAGAS
jgi:ABC-type transporter Mla MlaB component